MQNSCDSIYSKYTIGQSPEKTTEGRVRITGAAYKHGSAQMAHLHMFTGFVHQNPALL
jgi:hypothetical protein